MTAEFGPVYDEFKNDSAGAIKELMKAKGGEAVAVINKPGIGEISLVYGDENGGLAHIAAKRSEDWLKKLPDLLEQGTVYSKLTPNGRAHTGRVYIGMPDAEATIRLDWNGQAKTWLVTAFDRSPSNRATWGQNLQINEKGGAASITSLDSVAGEGSGPPPHREKSGTNRSNAIKQDSNEISNEQNVGSVRNVLKSGPLGGIVSDLIAQNRVVLHDTVDTLPVKDAPASTRGVTTPDGTIHLVASNLTPETALSVLLHEAFHEGGERLVGGEAWTDLMSRLDSLHRQAQQSGGRAREFYDAARERVAAAQRAGVVPESLTAEEFGAYTIEHYEQAPGAFRKWVDDTLGAVKAWILRRFGKQFGAVTPAQLRALAAAALRTEAQPAPGPRFSTAPATDMPAFKRWFGKSKVVDSAGKPLMVFRGEHGETADGALRTAVGSYTFTDSPEVASTYAQQPNNRKLSPEAEQARVVPAYLKLENPIINTPDDPFMELGDVAKAIGRDQAISFAREHADHIMNTSNWLDNFADEYKSVGDLLSKRPEAINDLYMDAYPLLDDPKFVAAAKAAGYDGAIHAGNGESADAVEYRVFDADQVRSAMRAGERYSVGPVNTPASTGFTPPAPSRFERLQAAVQDNMNRVRKVQDRIKKLTGVSELGYSDYYRAETNRPGRIAARQEDAKKKLTGPLMQRLAKSGFKQEQLEELLHAQHAQERNERIAAINPAMPDGGSGMKTADAKAILAKYQGATELHAIAQQARDIAKATLDLKLAYGLITQEDHDALSTAYQNYVPLKGDGEYGPKVKRAMGHEERDEHIMENIARDYDQAIGTGEKNLARQSLLALVANNPDADLWTIGVPPRGRYIAGKVYNVVDMTKAGGETVGSFTSRSQVSAFLEGAGPAATNYQVLDSNGERVAEFVKPLQDNEVMVYVKGEPVRIQMQDETLARQVRPLDQARMHPILEAMRTMNRYLSRIYTGYNPAFILRNAFRDAGTGTVNMVGNEGAATAAKAWTRYPAALKVLGQWAATGNAPGGKMGDYLKEYREQGGKTGASWMSDLEMQGKTLSRMYDDAYGAKGYLKEGKNVKAAAVAGRKIVAGMAHVVEIGNQATENALRLALYATLREKGTKPGVAAQAAKNVTVDFDRKGTLTGALGSIYLFFNPAVQGTANALRTVAKGKHRTQALVALGMLATLGFAAATHGIDNDKDRWLGQSWETRTKNFVYTIGSHHLTVPMSQEFSPAYAAGVAIAEAMRGESAIKSAAHMVSSFMDAYFPLNGMYNADSDNHLLDSVDAATPTVIKPLLEAGANRNSFGSPIVPDSESMKKQPDNLKMFKGTKGSVYDQIAQGIEQGGELVGANRYENDITKVSPETIKYLWRTYAGGLGQFVTDSIGVGHMAATDFGDVSTHDVPIVKDFWKDNDIKDIRARYYDLANEATEAQNEFAAAKKARDGQAIQDIFQRPGQAELIAANKVYTKMGKAVSAIRDQEASVQQDKTLSTADRTAKLKALEATEETLERTAIDAFRK